MSSNNDRSADALSPANVGGAPQAAPPFRETGSAPNPFGQQAQPIPAIKDATVTVAVQSGETITLYNAIMPSNGAVGQFQKTDTIDRGDEQYDRFIRTGKVMQQAVFDQFAASEQKTVQQAGARTPAPAAPQGDGISTTSVSQYKRDAARHNAQELEDDATRSRDAARQWEARANFLSRHAFTALETQAAQLGANIDPQGDGERHTLERRIANMRQNAKWEGNDAQRSASRSIAAGAQEHTGTKFNTFDPSDSRDVAANQAAIEGDPVLAKMFDNVRSRQAAEAAGATAAHMLAMVPAWKAATEREQRKIYHGQTEAEWMAGKKGRSDEALDKLQKTYHSVAEALTDPMNTIFEKQGSGQYRVKLPKGLVLIDWNKETGEITLGASKVSAFGKTAGGLDGLELHPDFERVEGHDNRVKMQLPQGVKLNSSSFSLSQRITIATNEIKRYAGEIGVRRRVDQLEGMVAELEERKASGDYSPLSHEIMAAVHGLRPSSVQQQQGQHFDGNHYNNANSGVQANQVASARSGPSTPGG